MGGAEILLAVIGLIVSTWSHFTSLFGAVGVIATLGGIGVCFS